MVKVRLMGGGGFSTKVDIKKLTVHACRVNSDVHMYHCMFSGFNHETACVTCINVQQQLVLNQNNTHNICMISYQQR